MLPSSNRVKLNRVAFKDVKLTQQRRFPRSLNSVTTSNRKQEEKQLLSVGDTTSVQTSVTTDQMGRDRVTETTSNVAEVEPEEKQQSCKGEDGNNCMEVKQQGPHTRGKGAKQTDTRSRQDGLRKLCDLRLRFTWCFCNDSALFKRPEVKHRGKMSATNSQKQANSSARSKPRHVNTNRKTRVAGRGRGRGPSKARSTTTTTGWDPAAAAAAANTRQVQTGARSIPTGLSNVTGTMHPSPTGLEHSEGTPGEQGQKSSRPGAEQPTAEVKIKKDNAAAVTSKKIIIWIDEYPKVTLCDVAQKCDSSGHGCGFLLPDVLKSKVVHCFKRDMRAGFRFDPGCLGQHKSEEKREFCPRVQSQKSLTEHQRQPSERTDVRTLSSRSAASFSQCKGTKKRERRTGALDRDVDEDPGILNGAGIHRKKRRKLADSVQDPISPSTPDLGSKDAAKADSRDRVEPRLSISEASQSFLGHAAVKENHEKPGGETDNPLKTDAAQEVLCQSDEVDTDEPESFTCQRVRAYFRKIPFSCARTCMSWPFSGRTLKAPTAARTEPLARGRSDSSLNQNQPGSSTLPEAPTGASSAHQVSLQNEEKQEDVRERILAERNGKRHGATSSPSVQTDESLAGLPSDTLSNPSQRGRESGADSSSTVSGVKADSSTSTPSHSALGLTEWESATIVSPMLSPFTRGSLSSLSATPSSLPAASFPPRKVQVDGDASPKHVVEDALFCYEEMPPWTPHDSDSFDSSASSFLLPQESEEGPLTDRSPPKLEPYYSTGPSDRDLTGVKEMSSHTVITEKCVDSNELTLPPILSPVTSPQGRSGKNIPPQRPGGPDEEEEEVNKDNSKHKILPRCHLPQIVCANNGNSKDSVEHGSEIFKGTRFKTTPGERHSPSNDEDDNEEENQDETECEDDVEQGNKTSQQVPSDLQITETSGALTEPCSSPSSDEDDDQRKPRSSSEEGSSPFGSERDDAQRGVLDEFTAYERDILLVDVTQDDQELFGNVPQESLLKLGPCRVTGPPKTRPRAVVKIQWAKTDGASLESKPSLVPLHIDFHCDNPDISDESRPWRPRCSTTPPIMQNNTGHATEKQTKYTGQTDANNNHVNGVLDRTPTFQTVNSLHNHIPPLKSGRNGPWTTNPANMVDLRCQKSNEYCRQYFSKSLPCVFKRCRFQHVPLAGDEKFCVETVARFAKNPMCLQRAGAVFTSYYQNNPPGAYFTMPVLLALLWALLKAGMVSDVFSVLSVSSAHNIGPGHEFLLALFSLVREKGLVGFVPELMQLTFKMASAGLVLSLDCFDCIKNTPELQQTVNPNSKLVSVPGNHKLSPSAPFPEYLYLAHSIVEIELCTKQEDWRLMGDVFRSICQSSQHVNQMGRISGRIAIALLSESKDKLSLPFAAFAETLCQNEGEESLLRSYLGRIGVSLMLRYHKTHQWAKGRRVVEVLSTSKVNYSTLKGLFGNEDGASRCYLVTVATELFLLSGSLEGALHTLRENKWFLSSCSWPCEAADLESRTRVLICLAEKTSQRDTLEVLSNLPGLKEPNDSVNLSSYRPLFNSHLRVCADRQILPVAADTVDFMLCKKLPVDHALLQILLQKLGKQNQWLRAREVFRHSLSEGYYAGVSAPPGFMALIVPCHLHEVELALSFEMFITVNATDIYRLPETTTPCLSITLKRTQSCESDYLSAGCRVLSAACIPQPKLIVHYMAVNSSQEQVFTLDVSSARCWLRHNHMWANEVWTH